MFAGRITLVVWIAAAASAQTGADVIEDLRSRAVNALEAIPRAHGRTELEAQREGLRRRLEESLGTGLLPTPTYVESYSVGTIPDDGFRIEKIVFQTLPNVWAPGHLYLPAGLEVPAPTVLFLPGHWWDEGKMHRDARAFASHLARLGFGVFVFDPMGMGERGPAPSDHRRADGLLVGVSQQGLVQYEIQRALQYLESRQELDRERFGLAGVDEGGFSAWITAALDDRIRAVAVVDGSADFKERIATKFAADDGEPVDQCHAIPGLLRYADVHELMALTAPRPALVLETSAGPSVDAVAEYGREIYSSLGPGKGFSFATDDGGPGYSQKRRDAAYGWFQRHFHNGRDGRSIRESPSAVLAVDAPELRCLPEGTVASAEPGVSAALRQLRETAHSSTEFRPEELPTKPLPRFPPSLGLNVGRSSTEWMTTQAGIDIPLLVLRPGPTGAAPANGTLIAVSDDGREALEADPLVREAIDQRGWAVWAIDPRGIGRMQTGKPGWVFETSQLLGEDFLWRQGTDIQRVVEVADAFSTHRVGLYLKGRNAVLAGVYAAAAAGPAPEFVVIADGELDYPQAVDDETPPHLFPLQALRAGLLSSVRTMTVDQLRESNWP